MYNYSPVKSIYIKNFRNLGEVQLDFKDSPIITLIGENESGKTSVVKAFATCALNADQRNQKAFIRDGTQGFGVAIELEDGTMVTRMKTATSNRYTVKKPDGQVWDASKLENEIPKAVYEVMGMTEEPETKEYIHIRTYEDQLLFVVTPASTNYKVMYDALKISSLTRAIKYGSTEANALKQRISAGETSVVALSTSLASIKTYDIEPLLNLRNKILKDKELLEKLDRVVELKRSIDSMTATLGSLSLIDKNGLTPIDEVMTDKLVRVGNLLDSIAKSNRVMSIYRELDSAEEVDIHLFEKLESAMSRKLDLARMASQSSSYIELANVHEVSELLITQLDRAQGLSSAIKDSNRRLAIYAELEKLNPIDSAVSSLDKIQNAIAIRDNIRVNSSTVGEYDKYIEGVINWMKQVGVATTSCPRCGEDVIIDLDMIKEST